MKEILSENVVPICDFKAQAAHWLKKIKDRGHPVMITQNGRAAGVMLKPDVYDYMLEKERLLTAVAIGLADAKAERTCDIPTLLDSLGLKE